MLNIEKTIQYNYISYIRYFKNKFDTKERAIEKRLRQVKLAPRKHIYE